MLQKNLAEFSTRVYADLFGFAWVFKYLSSLTVGSVGSLHVNIKFVMTAPQYAVI